MKTAFFYIIGAEEIEPVKVGVAACLSSRLASIQTGNPYKLSVKYSAKMPRNHALVLERSVLTYFSSNREVGEWLSVDWRILMEFVDNTDLANRDYNSAATKTSAIRYFGSIAALAEALSIDRAAISQWQNDRVPQLRQYELERITGGALRASWPIDDDRSAA